jgi:hypothetical protein
MSMYICDNMPQCPRLERFCADRSLFFAPLDLRWGVTSEQSGSGQVIKICFDEVERSRPYFVASLGFRNGWALSSDYKDELLEKTFDIGTIAYPWVRDARDRSVTELEILQGLLNAPEAMPRAFVYFRDVSYLERLDAAGLKVYVDMGENETKLMNLKERIVRAGFPVKFFKSPEEMVKLFETDLVASLAADFPSPKLLTYVIALCVLCVRMRERESRALRCGHRTLTLTWLSAHLPFELKRLSMSPCPSSLRTPSISPFVIDSRPLESDLAEQDAFADLRCRVFVGGQQSLALCDEFLYAPPEGKNIFLMTGESGCGKSSALAKWVRDCQERAQRRQLKAFDALPVRSSFLSSFTSLSYHVINTTERCHCREQQGGWSL